MTLTKIYAVYAILSTTGERYMPDGAWFFTTREAAEDRATYYKNVDLGYEIVEYELADIRKE